MKTLVESQFGCCPLTCMFYNRNIFLLRIFYDYFTSSFENYLNKEKQIETHHENIQLSVTQLFIASKGVTKPYDIFH